MYIIQQVQARHNRFTVVFGPSEEANQKVQFNQAGFLLFLIGWFLFTGVRYHNHNDGNQKPETNRSKNEFHKPIIIQYN